MDNNLSSTLEIRNTPGKGKCIYTKVGFKAGETIFEEDPLVCCQFAWNKDYRYLACDYCMRPLETVLENINRLAQTQMVEIMFPELDPTNTLQHTSCNICGVRYCSSECREKAYMRCHKNLCYNQEPDDPLYELNNKWKALHYPPETMNIMLLARVIATIEQAADQESLFKSFMSFCNLTTNEGESLVHNLLAVKYENCVAELWTSFVEAIRSRKISVVQSDYVNSLLTKDGFIKMLAMLGRNGQGVGTSVLAEWVKRVTNLDLPSDQKAALNAFIDEIYSRIEMVSGTFLNNEGSALYLLHSSINHSCVPNAEATFPHSNNRITLIALQDIPPDEEISISYIDHCMQSMKYKKRQVYLRNHYLFTCQCPRCERESFEQADDESDSDCEFDEDSDCQDEKDDVAVSENNDVQMEAR